MQWKSFDEKEITLYDLNMKKYNLVTKSRTNMVMVMTSMIKIKMMKMITYFIRNNFNFIYCFLEQEINYQRHTVN